MRHYVLWVKITEMTAHPREAVGVAEARIRGEISRCLDGHSFYAEMKPGKWVRARDDGETSGVSDEVIEAQGCVGDEPKRSRRKKSAGGSRSR